MRPTITIVMHYIEKSQSYTVLWPFLNGFFLRSTDRDVFDIVLGRLFNELTQGD